MKLVLISDTHLTRRAPAFHDNWMRVRAWIAREAPDLVVHLGDITARGVDDAAELDAARRCFDGLDGAIRFLPGNHDIGDNPPGPDRPGGHPLDPSRLSHYRRVFGADRWALQMGRWQLIGLNAQLFGTGTIEEHEQFAWLERELRAGHGPLGVMLHKPLFRDGSDDTEVHVRYVPTQPRLRLLALLGARGLRFVVSGHVHQARRLRLGSTEHIWAPSTAYCIPDTLQERIGNKIVGFLALTLRDTDYRFEVVIPDGLVQHDLADHAHIYPEAAVGHRLNAGAPC